jgi:hypothetical protein
MGFQLLEVAFISESFFMAGCLKKNGKFPPEKETKKMD